MKERPILFSAPMVRALLNGTKTQTRRIVKPQADARTTEAFQGADGIWRFSYPTARGQVSHADWDVRCPYGQPGDRLWVREAWRIGAWREDDGKLAIDYLASAPEKTPWITVPEDAENYHGGSVFEKYWVQSTDDCIESDLSTDDNGRYHWEPGQSPCRKRPSIHMPRWASRITLEITGVRVERLQDISEGDARAEGARNLDVASGRETLDPYSRQGSCVAHYKHIWQEINGPGSWDLNPWVWVIEFKVL